MKTYTCTDAPIEVSGLIQDLFPTHFYRLPLELIEAVPEPVARRARHAVGGRIRFRTDSHSIVIRMALEANDADWAIPLSGSAGAPVYIGKGASVRYAGIACPKDYTEKTAELAFEKDTAIEDITIFLPRNETVLSVEVDLDEGARLEAPTPYAIRTPIVFYGSSITEGGCASRATNAYTALLSKWLDADYINLGFSGAAKGEPILANYIAGLAMSAFVYDYDHNAPSVEHLRDTHEPFFKIIRAKHPTLPILIMTRPDYDQDPADASARRAVIEQTYKNAVAAGDAHVAFADGQAYFGPADREECTIEGCHPNDVGFMRMATAVYPVLRQLMGQ